MKTLSRLCMTMALAAAPIAAAQAGLADSDRQIRFVSCCQGYTEALARVIANELQDKVKQPILVETRPGANGIIAADFVAKSAPDGYTVLFGTNSTHAANQSLYKDLPYDYLKDFVPVSGISEGLLVLGIDARLPVRSVEELTALSKREPGKLNYGAASSSTRAGMELYKMISEADITYIPYKTNPQAVLDILGGRIDLMFNDAGSLLPHIQNGTIRPLAVSSTARSSAMPDVPTMEEAGVPGYALSFWHGVWAPAGTPPEAVAELAELLHWALSQPRVQSHIVNALAVPMPLTAEDLLTFSQAEEKKWRHIVESSDMRID